MLHYHFDWSVVTSGKYFDWLVSGLKVTLQLSALGIVLAFILGLLIAVLRMSHFRPVRWLACAYLEFFRNTPLLVQIFFWYFGSYKVLPQAVRITVPPLVNQFLNLAKNSSLAMTIGVMELTYQARQVESYTFKGFEAFSAATLVYLGLSVAITALVHLYNTRVLNPQRA